MFVASFPAQFQAVGLHRVSLGVLQYSGKLSREKTFANFTILWLFAKVFSTKFGPWRSLTQQSEQSAKVFSAKIVFFTNCNPPTTPRLHEERVRWLFHPLSIPSPFSTNLGASSAVQRSPEVVHIQPKDTWKEERYASSPVFNTPFAQSCD